MLPSKWEEIELEVGSALARLCSLNTDTDTTQILTQFPPGDK